MFGIKRFIKKNISPPNFLFPEIDKDKFPKNPVSSLSFKARIFSLEKELKKQKKYANFANLITYPNEVVVNVWKRLLSYNPNNLGNWSISGQSGQDFFGTRIFEREVISKMIGLYHGNKQNLEGYITSGGTEANIFSAWMGRNYLKAQGQKKICLVKTSLTHYSIEKAADLVDVPTFIAPLNRKNWGMDVAGLEEIIINLHKKGFDGFLLPLTLGYTLTGTMDPYEKICQEIKKIKHKYKNINFFVWIDAALNGLIEPFLNDKFAPFSHSEIQIILTDFHKFGFVPYPAGLVLYRKNLRKFIEKSVDYLKEKDNTVLGSRSGISAVACWAAIHSLGITGYKKIIDECLAQKTLFLDKINKSAGIEFISHPRSINGGIILKSQTDFKLINNLKRLGYYPAKIVISFFDEKKEKKIIYKFFFLPNLDKNKLEYFFQKFAD